MANNRRKNEVTYKLLKTWSHHS